MKSFSWKCFYSEKIPNDKNLYYTIFHTREKKCFHVIFHDEYPEQDSGCSFGRWIVREPTRRSPVGYHYKSWHNYGTSRAVGLVVGKRGWKAFTRPRRQLHLPWWFFSPPFSSSFSILPHPTRILKVFHLVSLQFRNVLIHARVRILSLHITHTCYHSLPHILCNHKFYTTTKVSSRSVKVPSTEARTALFAKLSLKSSFVHII